MPVLHSTPMRQASSAEEAAVGFRLLFLFPLVFLLLGPLPLSSSEGVDGEAGGGLEPLDEMLSTLHP